MRRHVEILHLGLKKHECEICGEKLKVAYSQKVVFVTLDPSSKLTKMKISIPKYADFGPIGYALSCCSILYLGFSILLHSGLNPVRHFWLSTRFSFCLKMKSVENISGYIQEAVSLERIFEIVQENNLKCSKLIHFQATKN